MRIIGGLHRSRRIQPPDDDETTRPITDRVKVALFDRLETYGLLEEGAALDLFAGTGSLGLEALSRGSEHCTFIERDHRVREILEANIELLKLGDRSRVMNVSALTTGWMATLPRTPLRVVFCDPPYALTDDEKSRPQILELIRLLAPLMEPGGVCMLRTQAAVDAGPIEGWMDPKRHAYGTMALHFYQTQLPAE